MLRSMFVRPEDIGALLKSSKYLARVFKRGDTQEAISLLGATLHEKTVLGVEKNDGIIRQDVPKKSDLFCRSRTFCTGRHHGYAAGFKSSTWPLFPCAKEVLQDTTGLQVWKKNWRIKDPLEFKLNVDGPDDAGMETDETLAETRELLTTIKNKIKSITQINVTPDHLGRTLPGV
ncbi:MAG: hypothetical protein R2874_12015 [Desulfobacterales bacterium]